MAGVLPADLSTPSTIAANLKTITVTTLTVLDYIAGQFRRNIPQIQDEVVVEVVGQPGASKQELYFLALAAANGIARKVQPLLQLNPFLPPSAASLMIEYDAADHWVRCSLMYRSAAISGFDKFSPSISSLFATDAGFSAFSFVVPVAAMTDQISKLTTDPEFFNQSVVYRGPRCDVVGAPLGFVSNELPGIPGAPGTARNRGAAPKLPWVSRTILTSCPTVQDPYPLPAIEQPPPRSLDVHRTTLIESPNPKPSGDKRSRGSVPGTPTGSALGAVTPDKCCPKTNYIVHLVTAALTYPGGTAFETFTPP